MCIITAKILVVKMMLPADAIISQWLVFIGLNSDLGC